MMVKKLAFIPALLVSISSFAEDIKNDTVVPERSVMILEEQQANEVAHEFQALEQAIAALESEDAQNADLISLERLLLEPTIKEAYDTLSDEQKLQYSQMLRDFNTIVNGTIEKIDSLLIKNQDIYNVLKKLGINIELSVGLSRENQEAPAVVA